MLWDNAHRVIAALGARPLGWNVAVLQPLCFYAKNAQTMTNWVELATWSGNILTATCVGKSLEEGLGRTCDVIY